MWLSSLTAAERDLVGKLKKKLVMKLSNKPCSTGEEGGGSAAGDGGSDLVSAVLGAISQTVAAVVRQLSGDGSEATPASAEQHQSAAPPKVRRERSQFQCPMCQTSLNAHLRQTECVQCEQCGARFLVQPCPAEATASPPLRQRSLD